MPGSLRLGLFLCYKPSMLSLLPRNEQRKSRNSQVRRKDTLRLWRPSRDTTHQSRGVQYWRSEVTARTGASPSEQKQC